MSAYLIELGVDAESDSNKSAVLDPLIIGPFPDRSAAEAFAQKVALGEECYRLGGYSAYHVIDDAGCTCTPEHYCEEYADHIEYALEDRAKREEARA